jgi:hypothetical protein
MDMVIYFYMAKNHGPHFVYKSYFCGIIFSNVNYNSPHI